MPAGMAAIIGRPWGAAQAVFTGIGGESPMGGGKDGRVGEAEVIVNLTPQSDGDEGANVEQLWS